MGKDKRLWRKLVKKLRRKRKRQTRAHTQMLVTEGGNHEETDGQQVDSSDSDQEKGQDVNVTDTRYFLPREEWENREKQAELAAILTQIETDRLEEIQKENQRKIREEWEAKQEHEKKLREEKARVEQQMKEKQETEFNEFLSFLSGDIETPPTKYLLPETISDDENVCYYFLKTAACRFYDGCTKLHARPTLSTAILIPNFFTHFKLEQSTRDEYDSDLGLEYEDQELQKEFLEFYEDVVPELRKCGTLIQFKVCCNLEPHLRGNVYIQYRTIKEAVQAFRVFNGRFYNGKQLSLQFIKMDSWRSAICGSFLRKACVKGRTCNYLHVFRNPTKEFVKADHDWKELQTQRAPAKPSMSITFDSSTMNRTPQQETLSLTPSSIETSQHMVGVEAKTPLSFKKSKSSKTLSRSHSRKLNLSPSKYHDSKRSHSASSSTLKRRKKDKKVKKKSSKKNKKHKKHKHRKREHKN